MQVNHRLPELQGITPTFFKTYVVLGPNHPDRPGQIKTVRVSANVTNGLVDVKFTTNMGRVNGIAGMTIAISEEPHGSRFLKELYQECGRMDNWALFEAHQNAIEGGREVDPFPDSRLPPCVLQWRARVGSARGKFVVPEDDGPEDDSDDEPDPVAAMPEPAKTPVRRRVPAPSSEAAE